jgi:DUF4097 and DUF4098 domain-containing protein YvlB
MNQEMLEKLEELFLTGKITKEQKELLVQALEQKNNEDTESLDITTVLGLENKELQVKLLDEDVRMKGDNSVTQVTIIKGAELVEVIKSENKIIIQSKKENMSLIGKIIKSHEIIKQKNGVLIQSRTMDDEVVISLPVNMISSVKTVSGDINIQNISSEISIKSVSGDIEMENQHGSASLSSISGDIEIDQVSGNTEITSKSGDIQVNRSDIQGVIKTYSGDIMINKSKIENIDISVFSGDININNTLGNNLIQCKSFSGDIQISLNNSSGYVKGSSTSGEIELITADKNHINLYSQEYGETNDPLKILIKTTSGDGEISFTKEE